MEIWGILYKIMDNLKNMRTNIFCPKNIKFNYDSIYMIYNTIFNNFIKSIIPFEFKKYKIKFIV